MGALVEEAWPSKDLKVAVMVCVPVGKIWLKVARPLMTDTVAKSAVPRVKVTQPLAEAGETVAVRGTEAW